MQKKVFLSVVMSACLMGTTATVFNACSNDEVEEQQLESKADYLRAKAKEFSKKYGVDIRIDEENILQWAETMTVEKLERKIQRLASLKGKTIVLEDTEEESEKGIKIRRTKSLKENQQEEEHDPLKVYKGSHEETIDDVDVSVSWKFGNTVSDEVKVTLSESYEDEDGNYWTLTSTEKLTHSVSFEPELSFDASGTVTLKEDIINTTYNIYVGYSRGTITIKLK